MPDWTVRYEADAIPDSASPVWTANETDDGSNVTWSATAGELTLSVTDPVGGSGVQQGNFARTVTSMTALTVEARVKATGWPTDSNTKFVLQAGTSTRRAAVRFAKSDGGVSTVYTVTLLNGAANFGGDDLPSSLGSTTKLMNAYVRVRLTISGDAVIVYLDDIPVISGTLSSTAGNQFLFGACNRSSTATAAVTVWDYVYYATDGAYTPAQLSTSTAIDLCDIPKRINTILSGRTAFAFVTARDGVVPARATAEAFVLDYLGQPPPIVWPSLGKVKVRPSGIGGHFRHEMNWKVQVVLKDLKQLKGMTLGALEEDIRAAFNDGNRALNGLTDIEYSRINGVKKLLTRPNYPNDIIEADLTVWLDRRYTDTPGTFTAGATNPRTIAKAISLRLDADADFNEVTFYEDQPVQPSKWPACWIEPQEHKPVVHTGDEHFPMRFKVLFQDYYTKLTRVCRLMNFMRDLEDRIHAEDTLNSETGVRKWYMEGYEMRVKAGDGYLYDEAVADVTVEVDI